MLPFVTRRGRDRQMRDRRPRKTGGVFAGIRLGFFEAENKADAWTSFAAVERSISDRLLARNIHGRVAQHRRNHRGAHVLAGGILRPHRSLNWRPAWHSGESLSGGAKRLPGR
jgi:hypothetical protein